ncbi:MAG: hypothetical protein ACRDNF_02260 [Streptosporangiaceae bacterium]
MQFYRRHRTAVVATAAGLAVLVLAAVATIVAQVTASKPPVVKPPRPPAHWLVTTDAITQLRDAGASASLISKSFGHSSSYVIASSGSVNFGVRTAIYSSYGAIAKAFATGALPGSYKAVVYDNGDSSATPTAEQQDPAKYERLAGSLLHKHGLLYVAAPAVDLVSVLNRGSSHSHLFSLYLSDHLAADAASYADVVVIQAQRDEARRDAYAKFVKAAAAQARAAHPGIIVLAGLESGRSVTSGQLSAAYSSVRSAVNGYWLIGVPITDCASCQVTGSRSALGLLRDIYS